MGRGIECRRTHSINSCARPSGQSPEPAVMPRYYITSTLAGETEELGVEEMAGSEDDREYGGYYAERGPQAAAANLSFNIRNVILPKPGYEHGTSYTYNGSPCNPAHPNTVTSNCRRYNNSAQCAAFGWEIIDYLFSTRPNPVTYPTTKPYFIHRFGHSPNLSGLYLCRSQC